MNDIISKVYPDGQGGEMEVAVSLEPGNRCLMIDGCKVSWIRMLKQAVTVKDKKAAWAIMDLASMIYHPNGNRFFNFWYGVVALHIARKHMKREGLL